MSLMQEAIVYLLAALLAVPLSKKPDLSSVLGAFVTAILLGDSEFRHQVEADINPFEGLLLGRFSHPSARR